jgi:hypothetical protein
MKEEKEEFCGLCAVAPLAFAGTSAAAVGGTMTNKHKAWKKMLIISGIGTVVLSVMVLFYYLVIKKDCKSCQLK